MQDPSDVALDKAVVIALQTLPAGRAPTQDEIRANRQKVADMMVALGTPVDLDALVRQVEALTVVTQDAPMGLKNDADNHEEWLTSRLTDTDTWSFWRRYERYISEVDPLPPRVVHTIDFATNRILAQVEDPARPGVWDRRGLVVGDVQSGKTANYTALVCKAADAGYKLIVVLAGLHDSLRSQTQLRLDDGFLGFDTQYQSRYDEDSQTRRPTGVGLLLGAPTPKVGSLTNSGPKGDFRKAIAKNLNMPIGSYPVLLVMKKNRALLDNLTEWISNVEGVDVDGQDLKQVRDVPLFLLDDEADNASVNTGADDPDTDPAKVNGAIRKLLKIFDKSAYVGYTATPFANIYADDEIDHPVFGRSLFPRSFIEVLPSASNYFGPGRVFGLQTETQDIDPLPVSRPVVDYQDWLPDKHKNGHQPGAELPASLKEAVSAFVITCAARAARGQGTKHSSMLVHVTRFTSVQEAVAGQLREQIQYLKHRIADGDGSATPTVYDELEELWHRDFEPTTAKFDLTDARRLTWEEVAACLKASTAKIVVRVINGFSPDALEYYKHKDTGLSVIAVGGDKLSRGLTLDGLSVSYYLRASKMYDALLQMGRWFGYRPGYEDLCRLYTTPDLLAAYREITAASDGLRAELEEMAARGLTPREFGLRVEASSNGLVITSPSKMRSATEVTLSFSGDIPETTVFSTAAVDQNWKVLNDFVERLVQDPDIEQEPDSSRILFNRVNPTLIADHFMDRYRPEASAKRSRPEFIADYLRFCDQKGELRDVTVMLASNRALVQANPVVHGTTAKIAGIDVGLISRRLLDASEDGSRYSIRRVLSPADELVDLNKTQIDAALARTRVLAREKKFKESDDDAAAIELAKIKLPGGPSLRRERTPDQALLVLYPLGPVPPKPGPDDRPVGPAITDGPGVGFAMSFPISAHGSGKKYAVNEIYRQLTFYDDADD